MKETFDGFVAARSADAETLEHAVRYYLAERTGDLTTEEMHDRLVEAVGDANAVEQGTALLEQDPGALAAAAREVLAAAWQDPAERERAVRAIDGARTKLPVIARTKLPVIEIGIIATAAMYGLWLHVTGGVRRHEERRRTDGDCSVVEERITTYYLPSGPLRTIIRLFAHGGDAG